MDLDTLHSLLAELKAANAREHEAILTTLREVNGRVGRVELWKARVEGAVAVLDATKFIWVTVVATVVTFLVSYLLKGRA